MVISWEFWKRIKEKEKYKKEKGKGKGRNWLTFNFSVFFSSMDTDEYSKVYSEVSSSFPFPFFPFSSFLLTPPYSKEKSRIQTRD